jgi:hypothetical protein
MQINEGLVCNSHRENDVGRSSQNQGVDSGKAASREGLAELMADARRRRPEEPVSTRTWSMVAQVVVPGAHRVTDAYKTLMTFATVGLHLRQQGSGLFPITAWRHQCRPKDHWSLPVSSCLLWLYKRYGHRRKAGPSQRHHNRYQPVRHLHRCLQQVNLDCSQ